MSEADKIIAAAAAEIAALERIVARELAETNRLQAEAQRLLDKLQRQLARGNKGS